jgi:isopentenyl-diphosphate delta-isomerase type 1
MWIDRRRADRPTGFWSWKGAFQVTEEIFDVVNERDEVIGHAPRSEVHARSLLHRAVHVLVFNARGEVFLQKRSMFKDRQPGVWDSSASGHVDNGEDYDACAVREVREELGVKLAQPPTRLFKFDASAATDQEFCWVYQTRHEGPFTLPPEEIERGGWYAPAEVTRWIADRPQEFATAFVAIWQRLRSQSKSG